MADDESALGEDYRTKVTMGALNAAIDAGKIEGADGGMVDLHAAIEGLCDAVAWLVANAQADKNLRERKNTADYCRARVLSTSNNLAKLAEAGQPVGWGAELVGPRH